MARWMIAMIAAVGVLVVGGALFAFAGSDNETVPVTGIDVGTVQGPQPAAPSRFPTSVVPVLPGLRPAAPAAGPEQVARAAEAAVGPGARAIEIDTDDDGAKVWEVKVLAAGGVKHEVELDRSGGVLQVHRDD
ncbi:MAG: PepSY domain-containing protein [Pseudonocardiaceae bacterium]